jgi:hypothetical protein
LGKYGGSGGTFEIDAGSSFSVGLGGVLAALSSFSLFLFWSDGREG